MCVPNLIKSADVDSESLQALECSPGEVFGLQWGKISILASISLSAKADGGHYVLQQAQSNLSNIGKV